MADLRTHAEEISAQFSDHIDVGPDEVHERLETLVDEYSVPVEEARRSVTSSYLDEAGLERDDLAPGGSEETLVGDIEADEEWVDLEVQVADLWEPRHESIAQVGLLGDESGTIKFVAFATSDLPELEEGASYALGNVVTDEYEGDYSVKLNRTTTITELDEPVEIGEDAVEIEGALVDLQSGSGLIKRCPEEGCTRTLQNGRCSEHGQVDGEFDLRVKAVLDDGDTVQEVIFDEEATERLAGIDLAEAKQMAQDALDTTVVEEEIATTITGRYYRVRGPEFGRYVLADEFTELSEAPDAEQTLIRARSI
ncbi:replication factor A [Halobaculum sp. MBLA0147]|uniref:replication factor A n=1 Tax=Halobaculum sp. MBLA0147 TaxID=3079934 RepID=UPI00352683C7